jgi:F-type H+-transporting ATPase subunit b
MLIDWFTVGAQILNFLVLVWLLKRFLYRPVLDAIDAREKRIAAELADATATKAAAETERKELQKKSTALDEQREAILGRAADQAKAERESLLTQAQQAADAVRLRHERTMRNEQMNLSQEITRMVREEVFAIARKALEDLAAANLEERMGAIFMGRLREMEAPARAALAAALETSPEIVVRSTFEVPATQRATIRDTLSEIFAAKIRLRFETSPDTVCGIELTAGDQRIAWSIAEYLANLEKTVKSLLEVQDPQTAHSASSAQRTPAARTSPPAGIPAAVLT